MNISYPGHIANDVEMISCQFTRIQQINHIKRLDTDILMNNVCIWKKKSLRTCSQRNALQSPGTNVI